MEDPELKELKYYAFDHFQEVGNQVTLVEFLPFLRPFFRETFKKMKTTNQKLTDYIMERFEGHLKDFQEGIERDFCDALIQSKNEAIKDDKESAPYLTNKNLAFAVLDLFLGENIFKIQESS